MSDERQLKLRSIGLRSLIFVGDELRLSNKNLTAKEKAVRINASNCDQYGPGTLIRAFDTLDKTEPQSMKEAQSILELQFAISSALNDKGCQFDEDEDEWTCNVR